MLFNSYEFIFAYLPVVVLGFFLWAKASRRGAATWLCLSSIFFYAWWSPRFVGLLAGSIAFNYTAGLAISGLGKKATSLRAVLLAAAIGVDLSTLGYFKYANFFIATLDEAGGVHWPLLNIVLPLGISFFTFTQIAFLVDVHRGLAREYNLVHYALFVTYFPHLIAGPLIHHKQVMPQFDAAETYRPQPEAFTAGVTFFVIGLTKKVILADSIAEYATTLFGAAHRGAELKFFASWAAALAYSFQLYFDFSGYSDMAIGLSLLFGITLPVNFNSPYKAQNIIEFWRRWHITLAAFLRDYLYIPLGGNRHGPLRRSFNLIVTMLLGGLWHGANWTFVAWGALHGSYLITNHLWRNLSGRWGLSESAAGRLLSTVVTFGAVMVGWVFFRAETLHDAVSILNGMAGLNGVSRHEFRDQGLGSPGSFAWMLATYFLLVFVAPNSQRVVAAIRVRAPASLTIGLINGVVLAACLVRMRSTHSEFLYFQF